MDEKKLNKNKFKKYLKFIILGVSIFIASFIVIINYKQSYVALTLIPSVLLAFLQSNEKQEKLAEMQIEKIEKEQKEKERFEKMLKFTKKIIYSIRDGSKLEKIEFTKDNFKKIIKGNKITKKEEIIRNILLIKLPDKINIFSYFMKELDTCTGEIEIFRIAKDIEGDYPFELYFTERNKCIFFFDDNDCYCPDDEQYNGKMKSHFKKGLSRYIWQFGYHIDNKFTCEDLSALKQELPKILNEKTFDFDKETLKKP